MPQLSVIVPTYNREDALEGCLKAVKASIFRDYELLVVDCGSQDTTCAIARRYADRVIEIHGVPSSGAARNRGVAAATGEVIVNVDSDVIVRPDTLSRIADYFSHHPETDALTGLLSKGHPHRGFFSQYKNLYMHFIFRQLPERVMFLYGSLHAFRRRVARPYGVVVRMTDDLAFGQQLIREGKRIAFVRDLEVTHLKRYNAWSLIANDFQAPCDWAIVFLAYKGWKHLGRYRIGFAHVSKEQLVSVALAPVIVLAGLLNRSRPQEIVWMTGLVVCWFLLNLRFLAFLTKEKGAIFGLWGCALTFLDHLIMAAGIVCGFVYALIKAVVQRPSSFAPWPPQGS